MRSSLEAQPDFHIEAPMHATCPLYRMFLNSRETNCEDHMASLK
jgi:hypothetical protein